MELRSKEKLIPLEIYTDGSCKKLGENTYFGGWNFIAVRDGQKIFESTGGQAHTTNQRMELQAIAEALKYASTARRPNERVIVYSDSAYAINCRAQEWYIKWQTNGWINSKGEPVKNADLWAQIVPYFDNFWYDFQKVKGHSDVAWNNVCDRKAQGEAERLKLAWRKLNAE